MEKNSEFIRNKEFHIVFKGYKPEEVDKFLDIMSVEFDRLAKRNRELQESLDKLKFESTVEQEDSDIKKIIQDALVSAHKVAEDIKNQAKKEAEELLGRRQLEEEKSIENLAAKKLELKESIILLQTKYDEFKNRLRKTAADINQIVEETGTIYIPEENFSDESEAAGKETGKATDGDSRLAEGDVEEAGFSGEILTEFTAEKTEPETQEESGIKQEKKAGKKSEEKPARYLSNFENFKIQPERGSGFYFDKPQDNNSAADKQTREAQSEDNSPGIQTSGKNDDSPKRERKKIDIANPDIIENFFKASED